MLGGQGSGEKAGIGHLNHVPIPSSVPTRGDSGAQKDSGLVQVRLGRQNWTDTSSPGVRARGASVLL